MRLPRRTTVHDWLKAIALWMLLGASLRLYYVSANGTWWLPYPEGLSGPLGYLVANRVSGVALGFSYWYIVFPLMGVCWVALLQLTARYFGGRNADFSYTLLRFGLSGLPIVLLMGWVLALAGREGTGWTFDRVIDVVYRGLGSVEWAWGDGAYLIASIAALAIQLRMSMRAFGVSGRKGFAHFGVGLVLFAAVSAGVGAAIGLSYRMLVGA